MIQNNTCTKCGHIWFARTPNPLSCPKCKRYDWYIPDLENIKEIKEVKDEKQNTKIDQEIQN